MCPIAHVPHFSCGLLPMCPITLLPCRPRKEHATLPIYPITPVSHHPCAQSPYPLCLCAPLPMCPIAHVAYCPFTPLPYCHVDLEFHMPHCPYAPSPLFPWVMGTQVMGQQNVKWCQVVKKMSNVKKLNILTMEEVHKKNWHNEVHTYWCQFWHHMMVTKYLQDVHRKYFWPILVTFMFDVKLYINICKPH